MSTDLEPTTAESRPIPGRARLLTRLVAVRLRFPLLLIAAFLVVGRWDTIRARWDALTRTAADPKAVGAISVDTEYFCPMDPGVVSDWPSKCSICNMGLVRRKKGEAVPLPDGVVSRMQVSPYRVQLAGIRTVAASYEALACDVEATGTADGSRVLVLNAAETDLAILRPGLDVDVIAGGRPPRKANVVDVETPEGRPRGVRIELAGDAPGPRAGEPVVAIVHVPLASVEPFRSMPSDPRPRREGDLKAVYSCPDHPDRLGEKGARCPVDRLGLERRPLLDHQRVGWWCPMHPSVTADRAGTKCEECGGMRLVPRVVSYNPKGRVLAVPESAVVDTGSRAVVFVERMPGMFDGVQVTLGPRCGSWYPVIAGLDPGVSVATSGAFLLDAETRLNPALASAYFGASKGAAAPAKETTAREVELCPVTRKPLGSMGEPVTVTVDGRAVKLCCEGCEGKLRANPAKYLGTASAGRP